MYVYHVHGIIFHYVILVRARTFDIYVWHDIMSAFPFLWHPAMYNALCTIKSGLGGTYTSPLGGSMCTYVGRMWRSTTHPTLPETEKSLRSCYCFKE